MARKKPKAPDTHKSGFMVRLPEKYREILAQLQAKYRRPMTVEVQIAIDAHAEREGIGRAAG